jgi:ribosomal protein S18 acetylase RimI-like enzyme
VLSPEEQADRCAAGLHAHWRTQCGYIAGGEVAEHDGVLVTATNVPDETLNVAFVPRAPADPEGAVAWCEEWFGARGLRLGVELRVGAHPEVELVLRSREYRVVVRRPAMALHPVALPGVATPHRVTVRRVTDDADLAAFQAVQAAAFDLTPEVAERFLPPAALATPGIAFFVAAHDDVVAATAAVSVSPHGAGVVGVATLPAYRRRGLGRAVTLAAVAHGAAAGADLAWLYPSPMARSLYASIGFRALDETQVWVAPE